MVYFIVAAVAFVVGMLYGFHVCRGRMSKTVSGKDSDVLDLRQQVADLESKLNASEQRAKDQHSEHLKNASSSRDKRVALENAVSQFIVQNSIQAGNLQSAIDKSRGLDPSRIFPQPNQEKKS